MKNTYLTLVYGAMQRFGLALFLFASPFVGAYAACCAGHGGVASCNKSTGYQMCKDGTASPTCTCAKSTKKKAATPATTTTPKQPDAVKTAPAKNSTAAPATTTKPKSSWWGGKSTTTAPATTGTTSAKGCCSNHGGVASCNKSTGHQMCKDGTASPSCMCR